MDALSWADFILWLESRYPSQAAAEDQQVTGMVVLRQPGALIVRVSMDNGPQMVSVSAAGWQRFAVGQSIILSRIGIETVGLKGRVAGSRTMVPEDEDGSFVPLLYPERETGQLPQPGHIPVLNAQGEYADAGTPLEDGSGHSFGILLDDGSVINPNVRQIDHQARTYRAYQGGFSAVDDRRPDGTLPDDDPPKYTLINTTPAFIANLKAGNDTTFFFDADINMAYTRTRTYRENPGGTFAGVAIPVLPLNNVLDGNTPLTVTRRRSDPTLTPQVAFYTDLLPISDPTPPQPEFTFRSPLANGRSFRFNYPGVNGVDTTVVQVNETVLPIAYVGVTAFQDASGLTLLLRSEANDTVTVIPALDLSKSVTMPTAALLAELNLSALGQTLRLDHRRGHHSFPTDRGYMALRAPGDTDYPFVTLAAWDAYRDVPADRWRAEGLSKPRTRRTFEAGQAANPPAVLPPRPVSGLAVLDVYGARGDGEAQHSPVLWRSVRGEPLFRPPVQVETWDGTKWAISPAALAALSKPYQPGQQDDRTAISGRLRLTLHVDGLLVFVGRARGDLSRLLVNGEPINANWLGLDAGHTPGWPAKQPRGWHPFTFRGTGGPLLELDTQGLRLSALNLRSVTGIR